VDERRCCGCERTFSPNPRERNPRRWCSERCRIAHRRATDPQYDARVRAKARERSARRPKVAHPPRACAWCGSDFTPSRVDNTYCSDRCKRKVYKARHPESVAAEQRRYRERYGNPEYGEARRSADARRRARKRGARVETFHRADLAARDGWRCGLCSKPIDPDLAWPHPKSPSVDHVVPLAMGGEHSLANAQLAHLVCNTRKGTKAAGEQLRLA